MVKKFSFGYMILALCVGFAAALLSFVAPVMLIPAVALIGAFGFAFGTGYAAVALAFAAFGVLGTNISTPYVLIFSLIPLLAASATLIAGLKRKAPYRYLAALLALFALISLYGLICVPPLLRGEAPYADIINSLKGFETYGAAMGFDISELSDIMSLVSTVFYGYLIILAEFIGFITVRLSKFFCSLGKASPRPMAKFADWQLPQSLRIGIPVLAVGCIIAFIAGFKGAETLLFAVLGFILPLLTVQGAAAAMFMLSRGKTQRRPSGLSVILLILLLLLSPLVFSLFGLIELYARSRDRFRKYDKKIRDAFERAEKTGSSAVIVDLDDGEGPRVIAVRKKNDEAYYDSEPVSDADKAGQDKDNGENADNEETPVEKENHEANDENCDAENKDTGAGLDGNAPDADNADDTDDGNNTDNSI